MLAPAPTTRSRRKSTKPPRAQRKLTAYGQSSSETGPFGDYGGIHQRSDNNPRVTPSVRVFGVMADKHFLTLPKKCQDCVGGYVSSSVLQWCLAKIVDSRQAL